tara:strand:+ start:162 stop:599 length:438 start_codon:yes stop_codon:yes gene_type:complete
MSDLTFSVNGKGETEARTAVKVRNFKLIVDEPESLGGTNKDANPVEYILAGLAGCVNVVANLTAQELGIKVKKLEINAAGNLNPRRLLGIDLQERAGYKNIDLKINAITDASESKKSKWLKLIESRCPVSDNLKNPTQVSLGFLN